MLEELSGMHDGLDGVILSAVSVENNCVALFVLVVGGASVLGLVGHEVPREQHACSCRDDDCCDIGMGSRWVRLFLGWARRSG